MNLVILMGRLTRDPDVRYSTDGKPSARYTLAVDRSFKREGESANFINCVAFGKNAEFCEKYVSKGTKLIVQGELDLGSYTNKDGQKVYTTSVIVNRQEFAESKASAEGNAHRQASAPTHNPAQAKTTQPTANGNEFMSIPSGVEDELPFL